MKLIIGVFLVTTAALTACAAKVGGTGMLTDGSSVIGEMDGDQTRGTTILTITSPDGWSCSGQYDHETFNQVSTPVSLKCSDGRTGKGVLVYERFKLSFSMAFSLSDGAKGRVDFPFK